jgi:hypothetical protein
MPRFVSSGAWDASRPRGRYPKAPAEARTLDGVTFGSKIEAARAAELMNLRRCGVIHDLRWHPEFEVEIRSAHFCTYTADSQYIETATGRCVVEEVKSKATKQDPSYKLRRKAAELYYDMTVTEVVR